MDFDTIFPRLRGLNLSSRNKELIARVFVARPFVKSAEEVRQKIALEYRNKLMIEGENLSHPFQIEDGWIKEPDGISLCSSHIFCPHNLS